MHANKSAKKKGIVNEPHWHLFDKFLIDFTAAHFAYITYTDLIWLVWPKRKFTFQIGQVPLPL